MVEDKPSLAMTLIVAEPVLVPKGYMVRVRFVPLPVSTRLALGISLSLSESAVAVRV